MPAAWTRELLVVGGLFAALWLLGATAGLSGWLVLPAVLGWCGWHVFNLYRVIRWLDRSVKTLPGHTPGIWGHVYYRLETRKRKSSGHKKQVRKLLKAFNASTRALPDATVVMNSHFVIKWANDAAGALLGIRKNDAGQRVYNLVRNPDLRAYIDGGRFDEPLSLPSPVDLDTRLTVKVVPYGHKKYLLLARDVTRENRLEQMRRDFIANASHELRTPLAVLQGSIEQLELQDEGSGENRPLGRMRRQCERMKSILEDLLTLARLEGRFTELAPLELLSPAVLLRDVVEEVASSGELHADHEFRLELDESFKLRVSLEDLLVACSNLVTNAVRYTPPGGTITVTLERVPGGARIAVADTGPGIPEVHIPRLAERFYRVDVGRSREAGGTGLGLSIVKHALENYRSKLEIDSRLGEGSTFAFTIPAEYLVEDTTREDRPAERAPGRA